MAQQCENEGCTADATWLTMLRSTLVTGQFWYSKRCEAHKIERPENTIAQIQPLPPEA